MESVACRDNMGSFVSLVTFIARANQDEDSTVSGDAIWSACRWMTISGTMFLVLLSPMTSATETMNTPTSRQVDQVDLIHGTRIADPYRWLEADVRESAEVAEWVAAENAVAQAYLDAIPEREPIIKRLTQLWNVARYGIPTHAGEKYFYSKNDGLQNQSVLYVAGSYDAEGEVLIDPNQWSEDGTTSLAGYEPSDDGQYVAYQKSEAGSDWRTIHVLNVESGELLDDQLRWVKFSPIRWNQEGTGFYYNRYPEPDEGETYQSVVLNQMVYFHRIGTSQGEDQLVYQRPDHPDWHFFAEPTEDGRYLLLTIEKGTDEKNQLHYRPISEADSPWRPLITDFDNQFFPVGSTGQNLFLLTDYEAPTKRLVVMDVERPGRKNLVEILPVSSATLESVSLIDDQLVATYLEDVLSRVSIFSLAGAHQRDVSLPGTGSAAGFAGKNADTETFYSFTSYNTPTGIYRYNMRTGQSQLIRQPKVDFDPEDYHVEQVFYASKDGTRIPMFLAYRKGIERDGDNPTLLYGYGGFSISLTPYFSVSRLAWMEMGGIMAIANLRGGGEYGEEWHLAGKLEKKQNVFDDFIAAAEWLVQHKYTRPERLAIQGGSNGGLLVGAVMTQRPELFGACLPAVGVMDMLRFHQFTAGRFWITEYGSADDPEQFQTLLDYSPYHNIKRGCSYPATLITTADTDDRVVPMHSFKFAAALQNAQAGPAPILIHIETRAGHGAGTPTTKQIEQAADLWAFLVQNLGMNRTD